MGKAKNWVDENFPQADGSIRTALIIAYGAGLDEGLAEAQELLAQVAMPPDRLEWPL